MTSTPLSVATSACSIPLGMAFLCESCQTIVNSGSFCNTCGSLQVLPVSRWVPAIQANAQEQR